MAVVLTTSRLTLTRVPTGLPTGPAATCDPPSTITRYPSPPSPVRLTASTRATAAMLASASPRNPRVRIVRRSSSERILLVACRKKASGRSTGAGRIVIRAGSRPVSARDMLSLPRIELFQCFARRQALQVELLELGDHRVIKRQAELRARLRPFQRPLPLQLGEHLAGAHHHLARKAGEFRDMNAVAAVGAARHDLVQEDDALAFFADFHPEVAQPWQPLG